MGLYEDCIAGGTSPAICAATFGGPGDADTIGDLSGLVGNVFGETSSGFIGVLQAVKSGVSNRIVGYKLVNESGQSFKLTEGMQLGSTTGRSFDLGSSGAAGLPSLVGITSTGSLSEAQFNRLTGGGGAGGSAPSFASTQAAQTQAEAFARQQAETLAAANLASEQASREFQTEQNRLAEEAALKRGRLSTLTDLIQSFVASQAQARDTLANLQPDPFRFAAVAGGIAPFGTTPQQGFQQQLQQFASAPVPTADPNAPLPSIESAIQGLTGANVPLSPQVFGAAGGASIPAPPPGQSIAVKVGEKGEEVLRITAQGVEVIPLAGGMQEGGAIGFPFQPIDFDSSTLLPALGRTGIFGSLGFGGFPRTTGLSARSPGREPKRGLFDPHGFGLGSQALERLGVRPSLIRFGNDPAVFQRDPNTGALRPFSGLSQFEDAGFDFSNVVSIQPAERGRFQFGPELETGRFPVSTDQPSAFTRFSVPIIEPTTGTILPNPAVIASQLNRLRLTDPATFNLLLNAYETAVTPAGNSAGFGAANVLATIQAALPFGQERTLTGLR